jgi:hypothetical protein
MVKNKKEGDQNVEDATKAQEKTPKIKIIPPNLHKKRKSIRNLPNKKK